MLWAYCEIPGYIEVTIRSEGESDDCAASYLSEGQPGFDPRVGVGVDPAAGFTLPTTTFAKSALPEGHLDLGSLRTASQA